MYLNEKELKEIAYQLTAYERDGIIDFKQYLNDQARELIDEADENELISQYNDFVSYDDIIYENSDEFFEENFATHAEAVRAVLFGHYNYNDSYVKFNGYANLDSLSSYELLEEIKGNSDYLTYVAENAEELEEIRDNEEELTSMALELVAKGY